MEFADLSRAVYRLDYLIHRCPGSSEPGPHDTSDEAKVVRRVYGYCQYALEVGRAFEADKRNLELRRSHQDRDQLSAEVETHVSIWPTKEALLEMLRVAASVLQFTKAAA